MTLKFFLYSFIFRTRVLADDDYVWTRKLLYNYGVYSGHWKKKNFLFKIDYYLFVSMVFFSLLLFVTYTQIKPSFVLIDKPNWSLCKRTKLARRKMQIIPTYTIWNCRRVIAIISHDYKSPFLLSHSINAFASTA